MTIDQDSIRFTCSFIDAAVSIENMHSNKECHTRGGMYLVRFAL